MGFAVGAIRAGAVAGLLTAIGLTGTLAAAEPYQEFLQGLRARGYHDFALLYLEQLESRDLLPADLRTVLPYEKAVSLIENAKTAPDLATQEKQLDEAENLLAAFTAAHPDHPQAANAGFERAKILFERGRAAMRMAAAGNAKSDDDARTQARSHFAQSRALFQEMYDRLKPQVEQLAGQNPAAGSSSDQLRVETNYLWARLYLAQLSYEEALTYEPRSAEFKSRLSDAAAAFEQIYEAYRNQPGGWHARVWQGKALDDQGETTKALGIFSELLSQPTQSDAVEAIRDQALQFRLEALNRPAQKEYRTVVEEATEWLKSKRGQSAKATSILWERARALDALGNDASLPEAERQRFLGQALADARDVSRHSSEYRDEARAIIQRAQKALGRQPIEPKNFDEGFGLSQNLIDELSSLNDRLAATSDPAEKAQLQTDLNLRATEAVQLLNTTLNLAGKDVHAQQVNQARYMLAWVYHISGEPYHAAILGDYASRAYGAQDSQSAAHAAYLSVTSWLKAYRLAPDGQRDAELAYAERVAGRMQAQWPDEDRTADALMDLGRVHAARNEPAQAADWFGKIPESSPMYSAAQLAAGQAFWTLYVQAASGESKADPAQLVVWQKNAEQFLRRGIEKSDAERDAPGTPGGDALIAGKVSLAQIAINGGRYQEAIDLMTDEPHSVLEAIRVDVERSRPETGIKSRTFAALCYQLVLRAYVGTQQIDQALSAMEELEKMTGPGGTESVAGVYVQLGREIQKEIERLIAQHDSTRLAEVRASFDQFLNELFRRKGQMKYSSLIWVAETYYALGQGMEDEHPQASAGYFQKAAETYADILGRNDIPEGRAIAVKLRLVNCQRRQGDFAKALDRIREVLQENPRLLDAQFEAASVLQDWGTRNPQEHRNLLLEAINGRPDDNVWGWREVAVRLQRSLESANRRPEHEDKFYQARYNIAESRRRYGLSLTDAAARTQALEGAKQDLEAVAFLVSDVPEAWQRRFNDLYRDIQGDLNIPPLQITGINWSDPKQPVAAQAAEGTPRTPAQPSRNTGGERVGSQSRPSTWPLILAGLIFVAGVGSSVVYVVSQWNRHRRHARAAVRKSAVPGRHIDERELADALGGAAANPARRQPAQGARVLPPSLPQKGPEGDRPQFRQG